MFRRVLILAHSHSTCSSTIYLRHQSNPLKLFADDIQPPLDKWLLQPPGWSDGNGKMVLWWLLVFCWTHQNVLSSLSTAHFLLRTLTQLRVGWTWLNCKPDNQVLDYPTAVILSHSIWATLSFFIMFKIFICLIWWATGAFFPLYCCCLISMIPKYCATDCIITLDTRRMTMNTGTSINVSCCYVHW